MSTSRVALLFLIAAAPDAGQPSATYEVLRRTCRACEPAESAPELVGLPDCGTLRPSANRKKWLECVHKALETNSPFRAALADDCGQVFGRSRKGLLQRAWRDVRNSDRTDCGDLMILEHCSAIAVAGEDESPDVDCQREGDLEFPCSANDDERCLLSLSEARPTAELRCLSRMDDVSRECARDGGLGWPPVLDGPRLLCAEKLNGLECVPNQLSRLRRHYSITSGAAPIRPCDGAYLGTVKGTEAIWQLSTPDGGTRQCSDERGLLRDFGAVEGGVQ
jgi:hypothetical protein